MLIFLLLFFEPLFSLNKVVIFIQKVQQHEAVVRRRAVFDRCELEPLGRWDESSWKAASLRVDVLGILFGDTSGRVSIRTVLAVYSISPLPLAAPIDGDW